MSPRLSHEQILPTHEAFLGGIVREVGKSCEVRVVVNLKRHEKCTCVLYIARILTP